MSARFWPIFATLLTTASSTFAEEAVRHDGSRISGQLSFTEAKRFRFSSAGRDVPISDLDLVRFKPTLPATPAVPLWQQVRLVNGQSIVAEVRKLDATHLHVRTTWTESLTIPRVAIERVTHLPGSLPVFFDSFTGELGAWKCSNEPRTAEGKLILSRAGQGVEATLKRALPAGFVAVGFRSGRTSTRILALELAFVRAGKPAPVRIELLGPGEHYAVSSPAKPKHYPPLKRDTQAHRLTIEFDRERMNVFLDEFVLWSQEAGPGDLHGVKLLAEGEGTEAATVDDVLVTRPEAIGKPKSWADLTSDAVRSPDGDETFGTLVATGSAGVALEMKARKSRFAWPQVAEFAFRRGTIVEQATAGEQVRILLRSGAGTVDVLDGAVKSFDDKQLVLIHPVLGELAIPREHLEQLRFRFLGVQLPVDSTPHHLGAKPAFGFAVTKPEGRSLKKMVRLPASSARGYIVVHAAHLSGTGTPLEVLLNGELLGELNSQADRPDAVVRSYRLALPARVEKETEIELRLKPPKDGGRINGVDVRAIRLELLDSR